MFEKACVEYMACTWQRFLFSTCKRQSEGEALLSEFAHEVQKMEFTEVVQLAGFVKQRI